MQHPSPVRYLQNSWRDLEVSLLGGFQDSFLRSDITDNWVISHHQNSAEIFKATTFNKHWATVWPQGLNLHLSGNGVPYRGAEICSTRKFGYGRFRVRMCPSASPGVITSFFLYDPESRDEIDIEFGHFNHDGKIHLQCNYFVGGVGGNEYIHELSFDPIRGTHIYGFDWSSSYIRWFTHREGTIHIDLTRLLLRNPMHLYMNLWAPHNNHEWVGKYEGRSTLATYEWVCYRPR